ncbi:alanine racemase [Cytobacillus sp. NCCP-133]|uniref:alanine racemase n=1 Tax=Cytobacillus sp. NCCP-133 TaxID=766848 RepID=UPI00222FF11D|nr:alanine racemase [Cytobacillus sp. NCCP-133]GLB60987.1 alanine racemase 1 [Cytobacillus sp. NCCP-133]
MGEQIKIFRDTWAEINLDHISYNVESMKRHVSDGAIVIAVIKANGYGHGDAAVAEAALEAGASYLAVATLDEAMALRKKKIQAPILVMGASRPENAGDAAKENIALTVFQKDWLSNAKEYIRTGEELRIHLKFDTGMGRLGIRSRNELEGIESAAKRDGHFLIEGVFTHFATADSLDNHYFEQQLSRFEEMIGWMEEVPKYVHSSNSAAGLRFPKAHLNAVRMGISMYGLAPSMEMKPELPFPLKEAFSLHTKIVHVKKIHKGEKVSYGAAYEAKEDEWIATLPIGYADGWVRKLQGQEVLVEGFRVPIVGRICMDQCMIKLPYEKPVGTQVTLIGEQDGARIPVDEIARKLETINYEVTCMVSSRVPRIYKRDGLVIGGVNYLL